MATRDQGGPGPKTSRASHTDEGFLGRWSRRKAEAKATDTDLPAADAEPSDESPPPAADTEQNNQMPVALPDIDKMGAGSDFSVFMQAGVPPALKTKALRKLWRVKPELANLDGLLDYGEDLTGSFKVVDHLKTAYEVGKGFLRDVEEVSKEDVAAIEDGATESPTIAKDEDRPVEIDQTVEDSDPKEPKPQAETPDGKISKG